MADPVAITDPAIAAGVVAAAGAIGLIIRSRVLAARPPVADDSRQVWLTRAAASALEQAVHYDEDEQKPEEVIDLRPAFLRSEIDLTDAREALDLRRDVEIDLSSDEPTIAIDVSTNPKTTDGT